MARTQARHAAGERRIVETTPPVPRAILVGIQLPDVDEVAHAASIEELGRLVNTLGSEVVGTYRKSATKSTARRCSARVGLKRVAAITGGTAVVGSMAVPRKSKARERFQDFDVNKHRSGTPTQMTAML